VSGAEVVRLVARRELTERVRERSFLVSTAITVVIIVLVVGLSAVFGGGKGSDVGATDARGLAVARSAARASAGTDSPLRVHRIAAADARAQLEDGTLDAVVDARAIRTKGKPDAQLIALLEAAHGAAHAPPPLRVATLEPVDPRADEEAGVAFLVGLLLYGQLLTYGFWVASGVVEEKSSRVIEVILSAVAPRRLLTGKVIGLGLLALGHLCVIGVVGLLAGAAAGAIHLTGSLVGAAALAILWFVAGYAFYSCLFACAGALVPRQEELQSTTMPLTLLILVSFFLSFAVSEDPGGVLAHVTAFIPMTAPLTMPGRIVTGDAPAWEIAASYAITLAAAVALIPLAARIYEGGVLRTGSAVRLREAWRGGARGEAPRKSLPAG
jgi:ABC-2 type transport system permease protein